MNKAGVYLLVMFEWNIEHWYVCEGCWKLMTDSSKVMPFVFRKAVSQVNWQFLSPHLNQLSLASPQQSKQAKQTLFTSFHPLSLTENTSKRIELHTITAPITIILSLNISNSPAFKFTHKDLIKSLRWSSKMAPSWHTTSKTETAPSSSSCHVCFHCLLF